MQQDTRKTKTETQQKHSSQSGSFRPHTKY